MTDRLRNFCFTLNNPSLSPQDSLLKFIQYKPLKFIIFQYEIGNTRKVKHFQGYLELKESKSFKKLNEELFANLAHLEQRYGSQAEAIAYCTDKTKSLVTPETFTWGEKKIDYQTFNQTNKNIPNNEKEQWIYLENKIIAKEYQNLAQIRQDLQYLVIHHSKKIQELLNKHNPIDFYQLIPSKTIWIYGGSGDGKSCFTEQLLESKGYTSDQITFLKSDLEQKVWFELDDQTRKVLVIEEVRTEWPKYNSLINFIDKKTFLPVKGSQIRNNFELIVINSLKTPYQIYQNLPKDNIIEPLRRIYNGQVFLVEKNHKLYEKLLKKLAKKEITEVDFKFMLKPILTDKSQDKPSFL